jgi:polysaccharide export outer membrane protein
MLYPGEDFHLGPGDLISVHVFMQEYLQTVRLGSDGSVQLPFIGSVPLEGLTVRGAQMLIAERLRAGEIYKNPEVTIQVLDTVNGSVIVTGEPYGEDRATGNGGTDCGGSGDGPGGQFDCEFTHPSA